MLGVVRVVVEEFERDDDALLRLEEPIFTEDRDPAEVLRELYRSALVREDELDTPWLPREP